MSFETLRWARVLHTFGFMIWIGSMFAVMYALIAYRKADSAGRTSLAALAKQSALAMDIGATVAIAMGLWMLLGQSAYEPLSDGGWMHMKLTAVAAVLGLHGYLRVQAGKHARGDGDGLAPWMGPVLSLLVVAILVFAIIRPTSKLYGG